jgi:hypothetical protein
MHPLSQASMFIYSSCGKWAFLPLLWSFPPTATFTSFTALGFGACATAPAFSGPACLFTVCEVFPSPPLLPVFIVLIAYYSVFLLSLGGDRYVQGAMLI